MRTKGIFFTLEFQISVYTVALDGMVQPLCLGFINSLQGEGGLKLKLSRYPVTGLSNNMCGEASVSNQGGVSRRSMRILRQQRPKEFSEFA